MEDEKLKELLKIDFPEINGDKEKTLAVCKARNIQNNKQLTRFAYVLSSFVVLVLVSLISVLLFNNRIPSDVTKINNSISELKNIEDDEEKMLTIMKIKKEVQSISEDKRKKINMSQLSNEISITSNNLKSSAEWSNNLNNEELFYTFTEITNNYEIKELYAIKGLNSRIKIQISRKELIDLLASYFYLPYANIISSKETFYEEYSDILNGDDSDYCNFHVIFDDSNNNSLFNIHVYGSGYVLITTTIKGSGNETITNMYVSLVSLDYMSFKLAYGAYSILSDFNFCNIVSFNDIKSISLEDSVYWALLGKPVTYINEDQMFEYYNSKLKNLCLIENNELVETIQGELGSTLDNDTYLITIALNDGDGFSISVSKTTNRFIIIHGAMTYAGVGTFDYE